MIKLVISGGDSFTYGSELSDDGLLGPKNPSKMCWAHLIANKLDAKHVNTADGGRSNNFIVRHVTEQVYDALQHDYKPEEIFVQVMWTFPTRSELAVNFDTKRHDSPWFPIDPYVAEDESKSDWFKRVSKSMPNWQAVHDDMHERYLINKDLGLVDFAKEFYKITGNLQSTYTGLRNVLSLQDFLENRNIRYMFTYVNVHVRIPLEPCDKFTRGLYSFVKFDDWFKFPIEKTWRTLGKHKKYFGFDDWAKANKYEYATSHPLEKAHEDAAELIYEKVKEIIQTPRSVGALSGE